MYYSYTLPQVPKRFQPSVACPNCQHPNNEDFNFCQKCGYQGKRLHQDSGGGNSHRFPVDESEIASLVNESRVARNSSRYSKQKTALELEFCSFLSALNPAKNSTHDLDGLLI